MKCYLRHCYHISRYFCPQPGTEDVCNFFSSFSLAESSPPLWILELRRGRARRAVCLARTTALLAFFFLFWAMPVFFKISVCIAVPYPEIVIPTLMKGRKKKARR